MTIQLNIGQMAKEMNAVDKAKLFIAAAHVHAESNGKKDLLSPHEKQRLIDDARKHNEIPFLNHVFDCFKIANFIMLDLERSFYIFTAMLVDLERIIQACFLKGTAEDILRGVIYDMMRQKYKGEENQAIEKTIDGEANKIFEESGFNKRILGSFDYFNPPLREHSYFDPTIGKVYGAPNKSIVKRFLSVLNAVKKYKKVKKELDLVLQKTPVPILSESQIKEVVDYEEGVNEFINLKGLFSMLRIYFKLDVAIPADNTEAADFMDSLKNINKKIELTEAEIAECEKRVEKSFED